MNFLNSFSNFGRNLLSRISPIIFSSFIKQGQDIDGSSTSNQFGYSVAMNSDGTVIAIGSVPISGTGYVRVFSWNGVSWSQLGSDINGFSGEDFGYSIAINAAGNRVVIGSPGSNANGGLSGVVRVYSWNGSSWSMLGSNIFGSAGDRVGFSVSMNAVGDRIAVGAPYSSSGGANSGKVIIFTYNGSSWAQTVFFAGAAGEQRGFSVSLNAAGDRIATGFNVSDSNGTDSGHVRVSTFDGISWVRLGTDIVGEAAADQSGWSVALNAVGDKVIIGAPYNDGNGSNSGSARVYAWNGGTSTTTPWDKLGNDIDGEVSGDQSGFSVAINAIGDKIAIAAPYNDESGVNSGHVRLYSWDGSSWIKDSYDLDGEVDRIVFGTPVDELSGYSLSMNAAGNKLIVGAIKNDSLGISSTDNYGHARVYSLEDLNAKSWVQVSSDINGLNLRANDNYGFSVALNWAGDRVVIGSPYLSQPTYTYNGSTQVYDWNGSNWTSSEIVGAFYGNLSHSYVGWSVATNSNGNVLVYGRPSFSSGSSSYVLCYNGVNWNNYGSNNVIYGETSGDKSGWSVAMNANGRRFVVGAPLNDGNGTDSGSVRVHCFNVGSNQWLQIGSDIDGEFAEDQFGYSVAMNAMGNRIVAGAPYNDANGTDSGSVRIFSWDGSTWTKLGSNINGQAAGDQNGYSVAMNESGNIVVIGAPYNDGGGNNSGRVRVFSWNGSSWIQLGSDINGDSAEDQFGCSVSINGLGNIIAIGANLNDANGLNSGRVKVYYWNGSSWIQLGRSIDGEAAGDESGLSVSINYNGNIIAIGAPKNDGTATNSGHVRIYKLT